MKKFHLVMSIIFIIITFTSIFFVFTSNGELNAGYTVIPMLMTLSFSSAYRNELKKEKLKQEHQVDNTQSTAEKSENDLK